MYVGVEVVRHGRVKHHADAQIAEPFAQPLTVRVQPLATRDFVADRNNFRDHVGAGLNYGDA